MRTLLSRNLSSLSSKQIDKPTFRNSTSVARTRLRDAWHGQRSIDLIAFLGVRFLRYKCISSRNTSFSIYVLEQKSFDALISCPYGSFKGTLNFMKNGNFFLENGSWSCENGSLVFEKWKLKLWRWKFVFWKMEVEVVKMEVCFLKNGSWSCKNGSLFFEKWKLKL